MTRNRIHHKYKQINNPEATGSDKKKQIGNRGGSPVEL